METNKYLWQPRKDGPIHLRVVYTDLDGNRKEFRRSLRTNHWPTARKIRDAEFMPIILDLQKARMQLELIHTLHPQLEEQLQKGVHGGYAEERTQESRKTLKELLDEWQAAICKTNGNYYVSPGTAKRYIPVCRTFVLHLGEELPIDAIDSATISHYRDLRLEEYGRKRTTVEIELDAIRNMFRYAVDKLRLAQNPVTGVTVKRTRAQKSREERASRRRPPEYAEADKICTAFPAHSRIPQEDFQDYAIFARYTGMRQGEVAHVRTEDVVLLPAEGYVDVLLQNWAEHAKPYSGRISNGQILCILVRDRGTETVKTGQERVVPVADKLRPALDRRLATAVDGALFPFSIKDGGKSFGRTWLKKVKKIKDDLTMHAFRHYVRSEMANAGIPAETSKPILGHGQRGDDTHSIYLHQQVGTLKDAIDKVY